VRYRFRVIVEMNDGTELRYDERVVANNAKPDEEWVAMVEQASKTILSHATSQTPHHPFAGDFRVLISRVTEEEEGEHDYPVSTE
jgi:hypothetical protein